LRSENKLNSITSITACAAGVVVGQSDNLYIKTERISDESKNPVYCID